MKGFLARPRPALVAGLFFLAGVLTRLPFRGHLLYHWDSVNFTLALQHFDVRLHQPHPPGYLLYVALGWLVNRLIADPNAAYGAVSVLFSGLAVVVLYLLGREMFGDGAGLAAALFALTSPAVWFYGEVALTYILEAGFVTAIAWAAYRALRGETRWIWVTTVLLAIAGGIRQTTLVLFVPLWLLTLWKGTWRVRVGAGVLLGLLVLAWLVPTILLSGGLAGYLAASQAIGGGVVNAFALSGSESIIAPVARLSVYLVYGLGGALLPLGYWLLRALGRLSKLRTAWRDPRWQVMALWLAPNLLFYAPLVRAPGHTFSFLPALLLLAGAGAARLVQCARSATGRSVWQGVIGLLLVANGLFFLVAPPFLFGVQRVIFTTPTRATIADRDRSLETRLVYIREHFAPATTMILSNGVDFRHPDYYLTDYIIQRHDSSVYAEQVSLPDAVTTIVFFGEDLHAPAGATTVTLANGEALSYLTRNPGAARLEIEGGSVVLQADAAK